MTSTAQLSICVSPHTLNDCPEIILRYAVQCETREEALRFGYARTALLGLAGPPGHTGYVHPGAPPAPLFETWPTLVPKDIVDAEVRVDVEEV